MNERILELADQAYQEYETDTIKYGANIPDEFCKKFANLIVCECVKVMYDNAIERNVPPDISQTPTHYAVAVLEHFGVEE